VLLLAAVLFLNYVDRGALPTAAHLVQDDLHLTKSQLGVLMSAFFWSYAALQIPVGWLAERYGAKRVLAAGLALWAFSTLLFGVVSSYVLLIVLRLLLGIGESAGFPCTSKILSAVVPTESLGTANGIVACAYLLGPAVGIYVGGLLIENWGWRSMFLVFGSLPLLWLLPWSRVRIQARVSPKPADTVTLWMILRQRSLWGVALGHFANNYIYYFMLSWLPFYLVRERGFSNTDMTQLIGSAYLVNAVFAITGGWAIDRHVARGGSANFGYKSILGGSQLGSIACMVCMAVGPRPLAIAAIFVYLALCGLGSPGVFAVAQIVAGPAVTGRWVGVQNTLANLSGVAPALTGFALEWTGHFTAAFGLAAIVGILGFVGWVFMLPEVAELSWRDPKFMKIMS
jgi:MFS family permease